MIKTLRNYVQKPQVFLLGLLFSFAFWHRVEGALLGTFAFTFDPGRDMLAVRDFVDNHKISLIGPFSGLSGVFYGPWWYWILALPFAMSGGDPRAIAFFIALANLLVPIGLYILGKQLKSETAGIVGAGMAAFSPLLIGYSTQIWNPNLVPPLTMFAILLLARSNQKSVYRVWFLLGLALALITNFQISFGLALSFSFIPLILSRLFKQTLGVSKGIVFLLGFLLPFLPLLVFDLRHSFIETKSILAFIEHPVIRSRDYDAFPLSDKISNRINLMRDVFKETVGSAQVASFMAFLAFGVFLYLMLSWKKKEKIGRAATVLGIEFLISILLIFFFFMRYADTVWNYYLIGLPVIYLSLFVTLIAGFSSRFQLINNRTVQIIIATFFILILLPVNSLQEYIGMKKRWQGDASVFRNQLAIVDFIYHDAQGQELNAMVYTPPIYDFHYQYIFAWYGKKYYGRVPGKERKGNLYLIIEPNKDAPWLVEGWIKTVVLNPGQVVSRKEFPGEVVVEKRVIDQKPK